LLNIAYIFLYSACAVYLPVPSEAPMFWFPSLPRSTVLIVCALGKGAGAYVMFWSGDRFRQTALFEKVTDWFHSAMDYVGILDKWLSFLRWIDRLIQRYGLWGFLLVMSIPGVPMKTPIYSVSVLRISGPKFALAVMAGTVVRNSVVYGGYLLSRMLR